MDDDDANEYDDDDNDNSKDEPLLLSYILCALYEDSAFSTPRQCSAYISGCRQSWRIGQIIGIRTNRRAF